MTDLPLTLMKSLNQFSAVSLKEIKSVSVTDRQDTKFVFHLTKLEPLLSRLYRCSRVLFVDSSPVSEYQNRYFDTSDLTLYLQHHNKMRNRYKVRMRKYPSTKQTFLEIKEKNNRNRTQKSRLPLVQMSTVIQPQWFDFIRHFSSTSPKKLSRSLDVSFSRITLADHEMTERLTLDFNFQFEYPKPGRLLDTLVIAEVKQSRYLASSDFMQCLRQGGSFGIRISKYCLGILLSYPGVKYNRFKPKMLTLHRLTQNPIYREVVYYYGHDHKF